MAELVEAAIHLHDAHDQTRSLCQEMDECSLSDIGVQHRTIGPCPETVMKANIFTANLTAMFTSFCAG
jgi:hypothetical protein